MAEEIGSFVWFVNGEKVHFDIAPDQVVKLLESSRGGFATLDDGVTIVRANPTHVTHIEESH